MGDHGRGGIGGGGRRPPVGPGGVAPDPADRPGASGHRFGPGLVCSECGIRWDAHQRSPHPCAVELPDDPFARRPRPPSSAEGARRNPTVVGASGDVDPDDGEGDGR